MKKDGGKLRDLIKDLKLPVESDEIRMGFKADVDFKVYGKQVLAELEQFAIDNGWALAPSNYEGIRISFPHSGSLVAACELLVAAHKI